MLGHRLRHWHNIDPTWDPCLLWTHQLTNTSKLYIDALFIYFIAPWNKFCLKYFCLAWTFIGFEHSLFLMEDVVTYTPMTSFADVKS